MYNRMETITIKEQLKYILQYDSRNDLTEEEKQLWKRYGSNGC